MKILHLNSNFEQSTIYRNMFNGLQRIGLSGRLYYPTIKSKDINISNVDVSNCLNRSDRLFYFHRNKKLYRDIISLYKIKEFNVSIGYSLFSNGYLAYTLKKKYGIPYIVIVQNTDVNLYFKKMFFLRGIGKEILREAHRIIFISNSYKSFVINKYVEKQDRDEIMSKSSVIPFGIDDFWFENIFVQKEMVNKKDIKLLYVGKINKNKNILSTAKACEVLLNKGYNVTLTIVGKVENKNLASQLSKIKFIKTLEFTDQSKLIEIYREHDIFIMPSFKESFGLVYGEAMTQGLPVIYTRGQGFDGHFREGEIGFSVNSNDIDEISDAIINIIEDYTNISNNCIKKVNLFKWNHVANHYKKILLELK